MTTLDRTLGSMLGLAAGDALGTAVEFRAKGAFTPLTDIVGGGPFGLEPGQWTDDTSMALCLAESLVACGGFDPRDQIERYVRWWRHGHLSSNGRCFDIGGTVRGALERYEGTRDPLAGFTGAHTAGNGSLMRLAPVPLAFARAPRDAVARAAESSRTTHGARAAVDACRYFAGLIVGVLSGASREEILAPRYAPVPGLWDEQPLAAEVDAIAAGSFHGRAPADLRAGGYVVETLEAALWAFAATRSFEAGALAAANLGNDADTTAAVYGQLAGAWYGVAGIPGRWLARLALRETIERLARGLHELAGRPPAQLKG
jgi:ADP-ribosyl-[dinitrogen reductase] hydrolase